MTNNLQRLASMISALIVGLAIMVGSAGTAQAYDADTVKQAQSDMMGGCVHNTDTHVLDCVKGYHKFTYNGDAYWEPIISAQRCTDHCWGTIWSGTQPRIYKIDAKGLDTSKSSGCGGVFSPWAICWADTKITSAVKAVQDHFINPCVFGSSKGFGGALIFNLTVKGMFEGGLITAAKASKFYTGPIGFGVITVATCGIGAYEKGLDDVSKLSFPFN